MALYIWDPEKKRCFQIKGTVTVKTSGPEYEKIKAQIKAKGPQYPAKGLLILKITEVFDCTPDQMPGKKLNNFFYSRFFILVCTCSAGSWPRHLTYSKAISTRTRIKL